MDFCDHRPNKPGAGMSPAGPTTLQPLLSDKVINSCVLFPGYVSGAFGNLGGILLLEKVTLRSLS